MQPNASTPTPTLIATKKFRERFAALDEAELYEIDRYGARFFVDHEGEVHLSPGNPTDRAFHSAFSDTDWPWFSVDAGQDQDPDLAGTLEYLMDNVDSFADSVRGQLELV